MSLRFRINLLITALLLAFLFIVGSVMVENTRKSIKEEVEAATKVTVQLLTTVAYSSQFIPQPAMQREVVLNYLRSVGRVRANEIKLYNGIGKLLYTSPPSVYKAGRSAPRWFSALVEPKLPTVRLAMRAAYLEIIPDPSRSTLDAWDDLRDLIWVALGFFVLVNALVFWIVGLSLKPVRKILDGLAGMQRGEFDVRLPEFSLPELSSISHTFNRMATALSDSTAENQRLALVVQQSSDAIMIHNSAGRIVFWNLAAERSFGYPAASVLGKPATLLTPPGREAEVSENLAAVMGGGLVENVETQRVTRDGVVLDVSLSAAPLVEPKTGKVIGEICSLRDITEKKRADQMARQLKENRQVTELIQQHLEEERRNLARELHDELGQCATAIKTIGMTIVNGTEDKDPEIHAHAQTIVSVAGRLYDMVHDLIRQLRPSALDHLGLTGALEQAVSAWQGRNPELKFHLHLAGELGNLGERLNITVYRFVQECLTNAIRHAAAGNIEIEIVRKAAAEDVSGGAPGGILWVEVKDNGRGMPEGTATGRAGFGLLGMRERVEALHGRFSVDNRLGQGVRVAAVIPIPADVPVGVD